MDNRDLFKFDFVDRERQMQIMEKYLSVDNTQNYLWINGNSGIGKSFFIKKKILENNHYSLMKFYINLPSETQNINCVNEIIKYIESKTKCDFVDFIKQNYKTMFDVGKKTLIEVIKIKNLSFAWFFEILFNADYVFEDINFKKTSAVKILQEYLKNIVKKNNVLLIIDNFANCDQKSLSILKQVLYEYINNPSFKCIFITTIPALALRKDIQIFLTEELPVKKMLIEKFEKASYFFSILDNIFEFDEIFYGLLDKIYRVCDGNPESLKEILRKVYLNDGVIISDAENTKAQIDIKILKKYLSEKLYKLDNNDITEDERFVLHILLGFGGPIEIDLLQKSILYIHGHLFGNNLWSIPIVNNIISSLQRKNILIYDGKIKFVHDRTFYGLNLLLEKDINHSLISSYFYDYLCTMPQNETMLDIKYLKAYHSYIAQNSNWIEENYSFGLKKYNEKKFSESAAIFKKIVSSNIDMPLERKIIIAEALYESGDYNNAKQLLIIEQITTHDNKVLFSYYCLWGKIENILLNKTSAIEKYDKALTYVCNREDEIYILHLKHLALLETPDHKEDARMIFNDIALNLTEEEKKMMPVCYLLRNCNQFYRGETAKKYFDLALKIATESESPVDISYVNNNYGLELFRNGKFDEANKKFEDSYNTLKDFKIHETSYPLNNMAVYSIFHNEYEKAIGYLLEAKYLNQSIYAGLAIKVHLMVCYRILGNEDKCRNYMKQLEEYLFHSEIYDYNIYRKLSINLCISYLEYDDVMNARRCLSMGIPYFENTISEYRGYKLDNQINHTEHSLDNAMQNNLYYTIMKFEPWIITLSHD